MNDKHSAAPAMYKCRFHPCPYESKRESNCKQHMEKAHGWTYVRSKNNGKTSKRPSNPKAPLTPQESTPGSNIFSASTPDFSDAPAFTDSESREDHLQTPDLQGAFGENFASETPSNFAEIFGPVDGGFPWNDTSADYSNLQPGESSTDSHRASWDSAFTGPSAMQPNFEDQSLFGTNFDWSNMNHDLTSLNIQLATPATSVEHMPAQAFSRTESISLDRSPQSASHPSLSPGGHGDAMLYTPFSAPSNEMSIDEGYDDFTQDLVARPTRDFNLFDQPSNMSALSINGESAMFEDLASLAGGAMWTGKDNGMNGEFGMVNDGTKMAE